MISLCHISHTKKREFRDTINYEMYDSASAKMFRHKVKEKQHEGDSN